MQVPDERIPNSASPLAPNPVSNLFLSVAAGGVLVGLVAAKTLAEAITQWGLASEELLRGDRLPVLKPSQTEPLE